MRLLFFGNRRRIGHQGTRHEIHITLSIDIEGWTATHRLLHGAERIQQQRPRKGLNPFFDDCGHGVFRRETGSLNKQRETCLIDVVRHMGVVRSQPLAEHLIRPPVLRKGEDFQLLPGIGNIMVLEVVLVRSRKHKTRFASGFLHQTHAFGEIRHPLLPRLFKSLFRETPGAKLIIGPLVLQPSGA